MTPIVVVILIRLSRDVEAADDAASSLLFVKHAPTMNDIQRTRA
ncbi:unnamed protein product, partial [Rotaria magnacalcarata]